MKVKYDNERDLRVIEDVVAPTSTDGFDVRYQNVRRQAIGQLEQEYLHRRTTKAGSDAQQTVGRKFTRIPPLETLLPLDSIERTHLSDELRLLRTRLSRSAIHGAERSVAILGSWKTAAVSLAAVAAANFSRMRGRHLKWLPKRYDANAGLHTDWDTETFHAVRWTVPALVLLAVAMLFVLTRPFVTHNPPVKHGRQTAHSVVDTTARSTAAKQMPVPTSPPPSGSSTSTSTSPGSAAGGSNGTLQTTESTANGVTGGLGGGAGTPLGSTTTSPPTSPTPPATTTPSLTVQVPPASITVLNKPLVSTGGATIDP